MAEITDFPERRDQISIAADEIGKELKKMQGFKTVGPENKRLIEIFGGRNIPRKFTFAHMLIYSLLKILIKLFLEYQKILPK